MLEGYKHFTSMEEYKRYVEAGGSVSGEVVVFKTHEEYERWFDSKMPDPYRKGRLRWPFDWMLDFINDGSLFTDQFDILDVSGWHCYLCGVETPKRLRGTLSPQAPQLEHVIPRTRGGSDKIENLECACRDCNIRKGNRTPEEMGLTPKRLSAEAIEAVRDRARKHHRLAYHLDTANLLLALREGRIQVEALTVNQACSLSQMGESAEYLRQHAPLLLAKAREWDEDRIGKLSAWHFERRIGGDARTKAEIGKAFRDYVEHGLASRAEVEVNPITEPLLRETEAGIAYLQRVAERYGARQSLAMMPCPVTPETELALGVLEHIAEGNDVEPTPMLMTLLRTIPAGHHYLVSVYGPDILSKHDEIVRQYPELGVLPDIEATPNG